MYTYEIKTSIDFLKKLLDEREDFLKNPLSSRYAINCALTAWHLHEWVYSEYKSHPAIQPFKTLNEFRKHYFDKSEIILLRDLADGSKHFQLNRASKEVVFTTVVPKGQKFGSREVKEPFLSVVTKLGNTNLHMAFNDLLNLAVDFWYGFFRNTLGVIDIDDVFVGYSP